MNLMELCKLFGWQGGTIHQAEQELIRRAKLYDELVEATEHYYKAFTLRYPESKFTNEYLEKLLKRAKETK